MTIIALYQAEHFEGVDRLWQMVFPSDPARNRASNAIPAKLALDDGLFWVALDRDEAVIGTIMAGWDGHRGWLYTVAVDPAHQRTGCGRMLVEHALEELRRRGCNKVNLQIRSGNEEVAEFYRTMGFTVEPRTSMGREL
ncbi:MAG: GNAT family acetyltransferase [Pseudomonadota bacterium]